MPTQPLQAATALALDHAWDSTVAFSPLASSSTNLADDPAQNTTSTLTSNPRANTLADRGADPVADPIAVPTAVPPTESPRLLPLIPPHRGVLLFSDSNARPIQLLSSGNMRAAIRRRLFETAGPDLPSKRLDYRSIVRFISFRRATSVLECDIVYLAAAKAHFPDTFPTLLRPAETSFLHIDPEAEHPRFTRVAAPDRPPYTPAPGLLLGPLENKAAAARLIDHLISTFDLCRYHNLLLQAPTAQACTYKQMGRCPAPCDGSISLASYRQLIHFALETLISPDAEIAAQVTRMQTAAAELRFEAAGRIHQQIAALTALRSGPNRHLRPLSSLNFLALQPGPAPSTAKCFLITPSRITHFASLITEPRLALFAPFLPTPNAPTPAQPQHHADAINSPHAISPPDAMSPPSLATRRYPANLKDPAATVAPTNPSALPDFSNLADPPDPHILALITAHLFSPKPLTGHWLPLPLTQPALTQAWALLQKQPTPAPPSEDAASDTPETLLALAPSRLC